MGDARHELLRSWLTKASRDLRSARVLGSDENALLDTAVYHCQQAAEKAVKAFLIYRGVTPDKTHDIRNLTVQAAAFEPRFHDLVHSAAALTPYAWEFRYPADLVETCPTREEFEEALRQAQEIYDFVLPLLPGATWP